ncbi:MAG TPA: superoxide dismutase family protein, partial [Gemmatimonadaceae bacterium]|nr:superoxide dismutase family protein [Gemmatimonadaceae bacterium]
VISDTQGRDVAAAEIWQDKDNIVHVDIQFHSLPEGSHAIHFHAVGRCDPSGTAPFTSAGAHYNPLGRQHGLDNPAGPHAGDAPNFTMARGVGRATFNTDRVSITAGSTSLFDADSSSIVVHAAADDQISQPSGNSGGRIACGVLRRG